MSHQVECLNQMALLVALLATTRALRIGAFNVQIFGQSFAGNADEIAALAQVFAVYDIVCMQEIRDISGAALTVLMTKLNEGSPSGAPPTYKSIVSARLGRTSSKEQYAVIWRTAADLTVDTANVKEYNDDVSDTFEREPFLVPVTLYPNTAASLSLVLVIIHVAPSHAVVEIDALVDVYDEAIRSSPFSQPNENALLLGDFNADCGYVPASAWPSIRLRNQTRFAWEIGDDADSNVAASSCAYDRIVVAGEALRARIRDARVWRYDIELGIAAELAARVSDHYPVELYVDPAPPATPSSAPTATAGRNSTAASAASAAENVEVVGGWIITIVIVSVVAAFAIAPILLAVVVLIALALKKREREEMKKVRAAAHAARAEIELRATTAAAPYARRVETAVAIREPPPPAAAGGGGGEGGEGRGEGRGGDGFLGQFSAREQVNPVHCAAVATAVRAARVVKVVEL